MPKHSHSHEQGRKQKPDIGKQKGQRRNTSRNVQLAQQFARDKLRGCAAWQIEPLFEDEGPEARGADDHLIEERREDNMPDDLTPQGMSEIPLSDEDDFADSEDFSAHEPGPVDTPVDVLPWEDVTIAVIGKRAVFQIPDWAQGFQNNDLDARWETYAKVAEWLNRERPEFLCQPSFLTLAGSTVDLIPPLFVDQAGLHQRLGLSCDPATFSKHARACRLVWANRQMRLDALYSHEAKLAWCAQAAIQRQNRHYIARNGELGRPGIQPPRDGKSRAGVLKKASSAWTLSPILFVQLLCVLTKCKWRDVLSEYGNPIFFKG
jgi:hypothetical protein